MGAQVEAVRGRATVDEFRGEELPLVGRVAGLAAGLAFGLTWRRWDLGGLDDVGGRGLGRGGGVLAGVGERHLQLGDAGGEEFHLGLQSGQLLPQALAFGTRS